MKVTKKQLLNLYRVGSLTYLGGRLLKAHQAKPFLQDDELRLQLTRVLVDHFTPMIAKDLGVDLSLVTHSVGDLPEGRCDLFAPAYAQAVTFYLKGVRETHIHYYYDRIVTGVNSWYVGVDDYANAVITLVAHELTHCRQQQQGEIGQTEEEVFWSELEAYPTGYIYAKRYRKQVKALLKEIGF